MLLTFSIFSRPPSNQEEAKLEALKYMPCPTQEFFLPSTFILLDSFWTSIFMTKIVPVIAIFVLFQAGFFVGCSIYYLYIAPSNITSAQTRRQQRHFFVGIIIQTSVPIIVTTLPYTIFAIELLRGKLTQSMTNLVTITVGCHGSIASIAILMVHQPYRQNIFRKLHFESETAEVKFFVSYHRSSDTRIWKWIVLINFEVKIKNYVYSKCIRNLHWFSNITTTMTVFHESIFDDISSQSSDQFHLATRRRYSTLSD